MALLKRQKAPVPLSDLCLISPSLILTFYCQNSLEFSEALPMGHLTNLMNLSLGLVHDRHESNLYLRNQHVPLTTPLSPN